MLAARIHAHGGNEVLRIDDLPKPQRQPGHALVRMIAGGLNRVDLYMRNSGAGITHQLPLILGLDGAGIVEEADEGSTFRAGDEVVIYPGQPCGTCEFCRKGEEVLCTRGRIFGEQVDGTFAGFVSAPEGSLLAQAALARFRPGRLAQRRLAHRLADDQDQGAARARRDRAHLRRRRLGVARGDPDRRRDGRAGDRDLARSGETRPRDRVRRRRDDLRRGRLVGARPGDGADRQKRGVDVVIENVGKAVWPTAMRALVRGGRLVTCGATTGDDPSADLRRLFIRQLAVFGSTLGTRAEFADMIAFITEKGLTPHIDQTFPLTEIHAAMDRLEAGRQLGKIGLVIGAA